MREYSPGYNLKENEYLLKIRGATEKTIKNTTGFLTKLNKNGTVPKKFDDWGSNILTTKLPIYIFEETYRNGWKLKNWRFGESQNWAIVETPEGFSLEIYLQKFLAIVKENTIVNGEIIGEFKWYENTLIKQQND